MLDGSEPELSFTARRLPAPDFNGNNALQALSLTTSDKIILGDVLELKFGSELQTIQFMGRLNAFLPFGSVGLAPLSQYHRRIRLHDIVTQWPDGKGL